MEKETIQLPPALEMENIKAVEKIEEKFDSRTEKSDEDPKELTEILHAISNKDKLRTDVDHGRMMRSLIESTSTKPKPPRSNASSDDKPKPLTAKNVMEHMKDINDRINKKSRSPYKKATSRKSRSRKSSSSRGRRKREERRKYDDGYEKSRSKNQEEIGYLTQAWQMLKNQGATSDLKIEYVDNADTLKNEIIRMETELNSQKCIKFMRKSLIAIVSGIEFANARWDPCGLQLSGWSEHVMTSLNDYDGCFMRLYQKYREHATSISPEIELLLILGGSGMMFHLTQSFVNQNVPKFQEVAKESPELAEKIAEMMAAKYNKRDVMSSSSSSDDDMDDNESLKPEQVKEFSKSNRTPTSLLSNPTFPDLVRTMGGSKTDIPPAPRVPPPAPRFSKKTNNEKLNTIEEENEEEKEKVIVF